MESNFYDAARSMFLTEGWADLLEYVEECLDRANNLDSIQTVEALYYAKGQAEVYRWLLSYSDTVKALEEQEEDDASFI